MTFASRRHLLLGAGAIGLLGACGTDDERTGTGSAAEQPALTVSAIPDQDPEKLNRLYPALASRLARATGTTARYAPVTEYAAVVRAFEIGDVHLAWMGGLTGVQARSRVPGATALAQRDIDADFHSVFIASRRSGLAPFADIGGLTSLAGHTLTFGSETSTSGRLMPQHFIRQAGLDLGRLKGTPGFSGSHDATIEAVASGSFEVGAVNEQVWKAAVAAKEIDLSSVVVLWRSPGYADYHWLVRPDVDERFGTGTTERLRRALLALDADQPADAEVLDLFGAGSFVPTENANYDTIAAVAKDLGLLT
ncbi:MAG: putative selenate ABC transporter substrate-binding protein [Phycicoccus sp.]